MASGNIEAEEVLVAAELGGRITELAADEGDDLQTGDLEARNVQRNQAAHRAGPDQSDPQTIEHRAVDAAHAAPFPDSKLAFTDVQDMGAPQ